MGGFDLGIRIRFGLARPITNLTLDGFMDVCTHGSMHASMHGSKHGSMHASMHGSMHASMHGSMFIVRVPPVNL